MTFRLHRTPMTGRARAYLTINAVRSLLLGASCLLNPGLFEGAGFTQIRAVLPMQVWGVALLLAGSVAAVAAAARNEPLARVALVTGAAFCAIWAVGFLLAYQAGNLVSPTGMLWGFALAAKDLVVCRQPMWSPFEAVAERVLGDARAR